MKTLLMTTLALIAAVTATSQTKMFITKTNSTVDSLLLSDIVKITFKSAVDSTLRAWWPLGEGSGTIAHDSSGHGHHSTVFNAGWAVGGVQLSQNTHSVDFPDMPFRLIEGTWDVIVNVSTFNNGWSVSSVLEKDGTGYGNNGRLLVTSAGRVQWTLDDSASRTSPTVLSPDSIHTNTDTRITAQWGSSGMRLFIDGDLVGSNSHPGRITAVGRPLTIGSHFSGSRSMIGVVKDVKVYNRNLR